MRLQFSPDFPRDRSLGDSTVAVEVTLEFAIAQRDKGVIALVLGGNETGNPPELFEAVCQHPKTHELCSCPHAGETWGPASIWGAIHALGGDRIAHGVRAVKDPEPLAYLTEHRIGCDVCPTSNVYLSVYPSVEQHPLWRLIAAGVPVTINSDDPPMFNTTLTDEFLTLARTHAFTAAEPAALVRTGVEVSFLPEAEKAELRSRIDAELADAAREANL